MKISEFLDQYLYDITVDEDKIDWDEEHKTVHDIYVAKLEDAIQWQKTYEQHAKDYGVKVYGEDVV